MFNITDEISVNESNATIVTSHTIICCCKKYCFKIKINMGFINLFTVMRPHLIFLKLFLLAHSFHNLYVHIHSTFKNIQNDVPEVP